MTPSALLSTLLLASASTLCAQTPQTSTVDFAHDVQPILKTNCVGCHGPQRQMGNLRLDRKSSALKPVTRRVVPGNSANSLLFHRIIGDNLFGPAMPPTGDLRPAEVATLQAWIEQGANWPDALSVEGEPLTFDPDAIAAVDLLQKGHLAAFLKTVTARPALLNARGPEGSTPFMYAVLYTGVPTLTTLLKLGADPNRRNDANGTALLWAAHELDKTRLLLDHHADPNIASEHDHTPLMLAARMPNPTGTAIVSLLLAHGANPNPNPHPEGQSSPLVEAATAGNAATFETLLQHGAKIAADGEPILVLSVISNCPRCLQLATAQIKDKSVYTAALYDSAHIGDVASIQLFLSKGADTKAFDQNGHTALMAAAASDVLPLDAVKLLVAHGADPNARSKHTHSGDEGLNALDIARQHGDNPVAQFLLASGAKPAAPTPGVLNPRMNNELRSAIQDSIPLLQAADTRFTKNSGCFSCHNNSLTAMTLGAVRRQGFRVDESAAAAQHEYHSQSFTALRDQMREGFLVNIGDNFSENVFAYALLGLAAENHKPDINTDGAANLILWRQAADGSWPFPHADTRQPLCLTFVGNTALSLRALQLYTPAANPAPFRRAISLAGNWLATAPAYNNDDRSWRVAGLAWALEGDTAAAPGSKPHPPANAPALRAGLKAATADLIANQKSDGGWSDLPSMPSSAYATGKTLVALHLAGMPASHPVYRRGTDWLLSHQQKDGSWYVQTRALAFQPWSDAGFPHQYDQFISAAGTNWATQALTYALPPPNSTRASR